MRVSTIKRAAIRSAPAGFLLFFLFAKVPANKATPEPALFAKGVISTADDEFGVTFAPDGNTCYFSVKSPSTITSNVMVICVSHSKDGKWSQPDIAPFSGKYRDFNPCISPDGKKLFFVSNRPLKGEKKFDFDIWVVEKSADGWSEPVNIGPAINTRGQELGCSVAADGTLYFSTTGISGNPDIYRSKFIDGAYQKPESLDTLINTAASETDPFIAPDQSFLIFSSTGRTDAKTGKGADSSYPRGDLYISFSRQGRWTAPVNLGSPVNTEAQESGPFVSRDGKTLYFSSERNFINIPMTRRLDHAALQNGLRAPGNGLGDIYSVPVASFMGQLQHQTKPDTTAASLFGEGTISTKDDEFGGTFTPDGKTVFFSKSVLRFYLDVICYSEYRNGAWQEPKVAPFSGRYRDFDPVLSPDGKKMLFTSNRPVDGKLRNDYDIWMVEKTGTGWSDPIHLDTTINSSYDEHFASIASSGTIYFSSNRPGALGGEGDADFYYSKPENGHYTSAVHLLDSVSTPAYELDCLIAPDERFLLMGVYGARNGYGNYDIYVSENRDGKWTPARNLGPKVNSKFRDYSPRISPDGQYLFFTSERDFTYPNGTIARNFADLKKQFHGILNGSGNIYRIPLAALGLK